MPAFVHDSPAAGPMVTATTLPSALASAASARLIVRELLGGRLAPEALDTLLLLTTELVSNALDCAETPCELRVACDDHGLVRVEVADTSSVLPRPRDLGMEAESGRGLRLVDALADDWGATPVAEGKAVWFTLQT